MNAATIADTAVQNGASQKPEELAQLLEVVTDLQPAVILEIGSMNGGTLRAWREVAPDAELISVSLTDGEWGGGRVPDGLADHHLDADSHDQDTLDRVLHILGDRSVDFLFIDGDHSYRGVRQDFTMYGWLVPNGGVVAFHDILMHPPGMRVGVIELWRQLIPRYATQEFTAADMNWGGIGVIYV